MSLKPTAFTLEQHVFCRICGYVHPLLKVTTDEDLINPAFGRVSYQKTCYLCERTDTKFDNEESIRETNLSKQIGQKRARKRFMDSKV